MDSRFLPSDTLTAIRYEVEDGMYQHCGGHGCKGGRATVTLTELLEYIDYLHEQMGFTPTRGTPNE